MVSDGFFKRRFAAVLFLVACLLCVPCTEAAPIFGYKVVAEYPHSTDSYTEGFLYLDGLFYEGTGEAGHSKLLAIQPETGKPLQKVDLAATVLWGRHCRLGTESLPVDVAIAHRLRIRPLQL